VRIVLGQKVDNHFNTELLNEILRERPPRWATSISSGPSEAAVPFLRHAPGGKKFLTTYEKEHGKGGPLDPRSQDRTSGVLHPVARHRVFTGDVHGGVAGSISRSFEGFWSRRSEMNRRSADDELSARNTGRRRPVQ
jgi:hypothetical protein